MIPRSLRLGPVDTLLLFPMMRGARLYDGVGGKGAGVSYDAREDDLVLLQDVLEECVNGRTAGHSCPFCGGGPLDVKRDEGVLRVDCPDCGKFFKGHL